MKYITAIICALLVLSLTAYILFDTFLIQGKCAAQDDEVSVTLDSTGKTNGRPAAAQSIMERSVSDIVCIG